MATKFKYIRLEPADNGHKLCYTKCEEPENIKMGSYFESAPRELVFTSNEKACQAYLKLCQANNQGSDVEEEIMEIKTEEED